MSVQFVSLFPTPVVMAFDQRQGSSDGGALLLKAADCALGLLPRLAACVVDPRQLGKVDHPFEALQARVLVRHRRAAVIDGDDLAPSSERLGSRRTEIGDRPAPRIGRSAECVRQVRP